MIHVVTSCTTFINKGDRIHNKSNGLGTRIIVTEVLSSAATLQLSFAPFSAVRFPLKVIVELRRHELLLLVSETVTPVTVSETTGAPKDFPAITGKSFRKMGLLQINATPFPVQVNVISI